MTNQPEPDVTGVVEHLFRQEAGKMVATLTGIFGLHNLALAEDVVQEALLKALRQWSFGAIPENPAAWLMQVAKNQALDVLRRHARLSKKKEEIAATMQQHPAFGAPASAAAADEIKDDQLRMIFACCHPALAQESQVALTLKTLCGLSVGEIARAFLVGEETIAKRLTRARQRLKQSGAPFEIPETNEVSARLATVQEVLYLVFNEGYNASHGPDLIRRDLSEEAIRLARLLAQHSITKTPATCALLALFLLQAARFPARTSTEGEILLLEEQDRTSWDQQLIAEGMAYLERAASGEKLSSFHLQAGIAACHCASATYAATDWAQILSLYDDLVRLNNSPVIALNRAVALAKVKGAEAALAAVVKVKNGGALEGYYLFHAVLGELRLQLGDHAGAEENYRRALTMTDLPAEKSFLLKKLRTCTARAKNRGTG